MLTCRLFCDCLLSKITKSEASWNIVRNSHPLSVTEAQMLNTCKVFIVIVVAVIIMIV